MDLYQTIIDRIRQQDGEHIAYCWIAHVLESHGLTRGPAHNRHEPRANPCPTAHKWALIERELRQMGKI